MHNVCSYCPREFSKYTYFEPGNLHIFISYIQTNKMEITFVHRVTWHGSLTGYVEENDLPS